MKVREIMTTPVITAPADMPIGDVADLLAKRHITAVPIVDTDGTVVGLVSEFDLMARPRYLMPNCFRTQWGSWRGRKTPTPVGLAAPRSSRRRRFLSS